MAAFALDNKPQPARCFRGGRPQRWSHAARAALVEDLAGIAPTPPGKAFPPATGSEATDCADKPARELRAKHRARKTMAVVRSERAFRRRTLGVQMSSRGEVTADVVVPRGRA